MAIWSTAGFLPRHRLSLSLTETAWFPAASGGPPSDFETITNRAGVVMQQGCATGDCDDPYDEN
jgi:hypothetical protein